MKLNLSLYVVCDQEAASEVAATLSRVGIGFGLDGHMTGLEISIDSDDGDDDEVLTFTPDDDEADG